MLSCICFAGDVATMSLFALHSRVWTIKCEMSKSGLTFHLSRDCWDLRLLSSLFSYVLLFCFCVRFEMSSMFCSQRMVLGCKCCVV